jgi:hypothetical protein
VVVVAVVVVVVAVDVAVSPVRRLRCASTACIPFEGGLGLQPCGFAFAFLFLLVTW